MTPQDASRGSHLDAIVIGAGLAGLSAARLLAQAGLRVLVLEARARAGGRVATLRSPFSGGLHAEAGAMVIGSGDRRTLEHCRELDLTLEDVTARLLGARCWVGGRLQPSLASPATAAAFGVDAEAAQHGLLGLLASRLAPALQEFPDLDRVGEKLPPALLDLDRRSLADFLTGRGAARAEIELIMFGVFGLLGAGARALSTLAALQYLRAAAASPQSFAIAGGNDALPAGLARALGERVVCGAAVEQIEVDDAHVSVAYRDGEQRRELRAAHVVCAVPLPALQNIEFLPSCPPAWDRARRSVGYTAVSRLYLQLRRRPWLEQGAATGQILSDGEVMWIEDQSYGQPGPHGLLEVHAAGTRAQAWERRAADERVARALRALSAFYPSIDLDLERHAFFAWQREPWSGGAYPCFAPGQLADLAWPLRAPQGRLLMAGEHTSAGMASLEGALESGERAARLLLARA